MTRAPGRRQVLATTRRRLQGGPGRARLGPADLAIVGVVALWAVTSVVLNALTGFLLKHPLVFLALTGSLASQVTGGALVRDGSLHLAAVVPAAVFGCTMFDWVFWLIGRRYGDAAVRLAEARGWVRPEVAARAERLVERFGWSAVLVSWYVPFPNPLIYIAVGAARMRLAVFLVLDVLAALLWVALLVSLGYAIGDPVIDVAEQVTRYAVVVLVGVLVLAVAGLLVHRRRRTARRG
jgi:membrane protein DedA with SNARE-associated domain